MKKAIASGIVIALVVIFADLLFFGNQTTRPAGVPVLGMRTLEDSRGGMDALAEGTLIVDGLCLFIEGATGDRRAPVFPYRSVKW
jgi:hypothetical protein